jgi:chromate reductase
VSDGETFKILGFAGSLRKASFNRGLLRAASQATPAGAELEIYDLLDIPLYNGDVEAAGVPQPVQEFAERVRAADAVLIASPEYNYGMSGVLKNALDWVSRASVRNPLRHKPVAIMGASGGNFGTARSQLQLRAVLASQIDAWTLGKPEVLVPRAGTLFDDLGNLEDDETRERVAALVAALVDWAGRLKER